MTTEEHKGGEKPIGIERCNQYKQQWATSCFFLCPLILPMALPCLKCPAALVAIGCHIGQHS